MSDEEEEKTEESVEKTTLKKVHVDIYNFIKKFVDENVYSPEHGEIAEGLKISKSYLPKLVKELCEMGYISRDFRKRRSIKIIRDLREAVDNT